MSALENAKPREKCPYSELFCYAFPRVHILRIQSECGKMQTRIAPNTDFFHAVLTRHKTINNPYNPYEFQRIRCVITDVF